MHRQDVLSHAQPKNLVNALMVKHASHQLHAQIRIRFSAEVLGKRQHQPAQFPVELTAIAKMMRAALVILHARRQKHFIADQLSTMLPQSAWMHVPPDWTKIARAERSASSIPHATISTLTTLLMSPLNLKLTRIPFSVEKILLMHPQDVTFPAHLDLQQSAP
jgi:hypothetical protein